MTDLRSLSCKLAAVMLIALGTTACTSGNENKSAAPNTANFDRDSRNNEDNTLGAKSLPPQADALPEHDSVDKTEFHYNSRLAMNEAISDRLKAQFPELTAAYVALTESNIYAAVKLHTTQTQGAGGTPVDLNVVTSDSKNGAGLFAGGQGPLLDWRDQSGMTTELQGRISRALHQMAPVKANIFVSSNPYYVGRMRYYYEQARSGASMDNFINEFNTMSHYAFPANTNSANKGLR